jgi:hypothetical protein
MLSTTEIIKYDGCSIVAVRMPVAHEGRVRFSPSVLKRIEQRTEFDSLQLAKVEVPKNLKGSLGSPSVLSARRSEYPSKSETEIESTRERRKFLVPK